MNVHIFIEYNAPTAVAVLHLLDDRPLPRTGEGIEARLFMGTKEREEQFGKNTHIRGVVSAICHSYELEGVDPHIRLTIAPWTVYKK